MKAIQLLKYGEKLRVREVPVPKTNSKQLLVKAHQGTINPSDIMYAAGLYGVKHKPPVVMGFEGSGIVEAAPDAHKHLVGKPISYISDHSAQNGTWAEQVAVNENFFFESDKKDKLKEAATAWINPITAQGFLDVAKKQKNIRTVVFSAGNSAVSRIATKIFNQDGIKVVSIVRKPDQVEELKKLGAHVVLNQEDSDFIEKLKEVLPKKERVAFFDAVAGQLSGKVIGALPPRSSTYVYGILSGKEIESLKATNFIFEDKHIGGFWLSTWFQTLNQEQFDAIKKRTREGIYDEFKVDIHKTFKLDDIEAAVDNHKENSNKGKTLLRIAGEQE